MKCCNPCLTLVRRSGALDRRSVRQVEGRQILGETVIYQHIHTYTYMHICVCHVSEAYMLTAHPSLHFRSLASRPEQKWVCSIPALSRQVSSNAMHKLSSWIGPSDSQLAHPRSSGPALKGTQADLQRGHFWTKALNCQNKAQNRRSYDNKKKDMKKKSFLKS